MFGVGGFTYWFVHSAAGFRWSVLYKLSLPKRSRVTVEGTVSVNVLSAAVLQQYLWSFVGDEQQCNVCFGCSFYYLHKNYDLPVFFTY